MPAAEHTITVRRPVEEVFAFFTDPSNDPKWRPHVKEIAAHGPLVRGSRLHQVITGPGGRGISADIEVTTYEPPTRYAFRVVEGPVRPVGEFRFAEDDGGTRVSLALSAELRGLKRLVLSRSVQRAMQSETKGLERAKALIER